MVMRSFPSGFLGSTFLSPPPSTSASFGELALNTARANPSGVPLLKSARSGPGAAWWIRLSGSPSEGARAGPHHLGNDLASRFVLRFGGAIASHCIQLGQRFVAPLLFVVPLIATSVVVKFLPPMLRVKFFAAVFASRHLSPPVRKFETCASLLPKGWAVPRWKSRMT